MRRKGRRKESERGSWRKRGAGGRVKEKARVRERESEGD